MSEKPILEIQRKLDDREAVYEPISEVLRPLQRSLYSFTSFSGVKRWQVMESSAQTPQDTKVLPLRKRRAPQA